MGNKYIKWEKHILEQYEVYGFFADKMVFEFPKSKPKYAIKFYKRNPKVNVSFYGVQ